MTKIININPFIQHEKAEHFLNIYHDIYLKEDRNTKEITKTLNSLVGHFMLVLLLSVMEVRGLMLLL